MVYHFVISTQTGVFIFYGIKAMGATGNYLFYLGTIKYLNIHHSLHLEQKLITRTFGRIAGAAFFGTQNRKAYAYVLHYLADVAGFFLCTLIKTASTANPKQYFG